MPSVDYMGYTVVVNAIPAPGNCYYSVFAIHRHVPNSLALQAPAACEQGLGARASYATLPTSPTRMLVSARVPG